MESGWDVKHMVKLLVTSEAYRRQSSVGEETRKLDPENTYFARQARYRLEAEFVRDNALAVSGLLSRKVGGRSVKPYQPANYWYRLYKDARYVQEKGEDLYRRGLYTYWRRSYWHPSLQAFDAPAREECVADRPRSNTPQQSLVLLNDPTFVEAARAFATRILRGRRRRRCEPREVRDARRGLAITDAHGGRPAPEASALPARALLEG